MLQKVTRWLILQKARRHAGNPKVTTALRLIVGTRFQVLFHSPHRGTFHLSLTVLVHYRSSKVFSLGRWTPLLPTGLACPVVLRISVGSLICFRIRDCHPLWSAFPNGSAKKLLYDSHVRDPTTPQRKTSAVWAIPVSLAATREIDFSFFSCGYLDVSVHRVTRTHLCIQCMPVQESRDQRSFDNSPWLFAVFHALQSLLTPRHPPCALSSLAT